MRMRSKPPRSKAATAWRPSRRDLDVVAALFEEAAGDELVDGVVFGDQDAQARAASGGFGRPSTAGEPDGGRRRQTSSAAGQACQERRSTPSPRARAGLAAWGVEDDEAYGGVVGIGPDLAGEVPAVAVGQGAVDDRRHAKRPAHRRQ